jgi:hypothetical protein
MQGKPGEFCANEEGGKGERAVDAGRWTLVGGRWTPVPE